MPWILYQPGEHDALTFVAGGGLEQLACSHHGPRLLAPYRERKDHRRDGTFRNIVEASWLLISRPPRCEVSCTYFASAIPLRGYQSHGNGGHTAGAGVLGCATNRRTRSLLAVDGGLPPSFAGASAHQGRLLPSVKRTAIRPCDGSSRV